MEHFRQFVELGCAAEAGCARQDVSVDAGRWYEVSAYVLPLSDKATVTVRAFAGDTILASASETMYAPTKWWMRLPVTFQAPTDKVTVEITADGSQSGEKVAVDFVDLAPVEGLNVPMAVTSVEGVAFEELPKEITIRGRNLLPKDIVRVGRCIYGEVTFVSTEELRVLLPQLPAPGAYDLTVRRDDWLGQAQSVTIDGGLKVGE